MNFRNRIIAIFSTAILLGCMAVGISGQTRGTNYTLYGLNFLNNWQALRVSAHNPRFSDGEIIPCIKVFVILDLYQAAGDGSVLPRLARRIVREVELDPGDAVSFDFPATALCDGSVCPAARNGVYAGVSVFATPVEGEPLPPGRLKFNSTLALREFGRTTLTLPVVEKGFDPQPDPPTPLNQ